MSTPRLPAANNRKKYVKVSENVANSGADLTLNEPKPNLWALLFMCYGTPGFSMTHSAEARELYLAPQGRALI